ncbi:MAG: hypothetical protein AAGB06_02935 [Verrucomicrobiota bacterium]
MSELPGNPDKDPNEDTFHRLSSILNQVEDWGTLLGHIAHDLSGPVASMRMFLDLEQNRAPNNQTPPSPKIINSLQDEARKAKELIDRLSSFRECINHLSCPIIAPCPISELVRGLVEYVKDQKIVGYRNIVILNENSVNPAPHWDASMLRHSIMSIIRDLHRLTPFDVPFHIEVTAGHYPYGIAIYSSKVEVPERLLGIQSPQLRHTLLNDSDKVWHPTAQCWVEATAMARLFESKWVLNWDAEGHVCWSLKPNLL